MTHDPFTASKEKQGSIPSISLGIHPEISLSLSSHLSRRSSLSPKDIGILNQSSLEEMEAKHSTETLMHLEKQNECLVGSYRAMTHELHRLQVEEQMLMHKLYEVMSAEGLLGKEKNIKQPTREITAGNVESSKES